MAGHIAAPTASSLCRRAGKTAGASGSEAAECARVTPDEMLAAFHEQIRLRDRDAEATNVAERDGLVHRNYLVDPHTQGRWSSRRRAWGGP